MEWKNINTKIRLWICGETE